MTRNVPGRLIETDLLAVAGTPAGPWHRPLDTGHRRPACDPDGPLLLWEHDITLVPAGNRCPACWQNVQHVRDFQPDPVPAAG